MALAGATRGAQLVREILASWRLLLGAVVLVLACTPVAVVLMLVLIAGR
jgi:hypothetical protein